MNMRWIPLVALLGACDPASDRTVLLDTRTLDATGLVGLELHQGVGDLIIEASSDGQVTVEVELFGPIGSERDENAREGLLHTLEEGDGIAYASTGLDDAPPGYRIRTLVRMPADLALVLDDGSGDVRIEGVGDVDLLDGSGDVVLTDVVGRITIDDGSGDLTLDGCTGDLDVFDGSGDLVINDHRGDAVIEDGSGDIVLRGVEGRVEIRRDGSGDIASDGVADLVIAAS